MYTMRREPIKGSMRGPAWEWLTDIVEYRKPSLLQSAGGLGIAVDLWKLKELVSRVTFLAVYGDHDNLTILR